MLLDAALSSKMAKLMQKIVLFIEPQWRKCDTPMKIGNLFMNRFAIEEGPNFEILKIFELENRFENQFLQGKVTSCL